MRAYAHDGEGYVYSNEITLPITAPVVLTTTVTKQSNTRATLSGDITTLGDVSCIAGICLSTSANPTTADTYQSITVTSTGEYSIDFTGLTAGTTYHYRAFAHNTSGDAYGADATFVAHPCNGLATITDVESNTYEVAAFGSQCWTQRSMHTTHYANGDVITCGSPTSGNTYSSTTGYYYHPYNNQSTLPSDAATRITAWGYLYNWAAVNDSRGICPSGWHVGTLTDWQTLDEYAKTNYGCSNGSARSLASVESWASDGTSCAPGNNPSSNNASGFNAYPAGIYNPTSGGGYKLTKQFVNFWTSTGEYFTAVGYNNKDLSIRNDTGDGTTITRRFAFSIRCVKD